MAIPAKTDINPQTGKAYAVNPATGNWDDNYWANTVEPQLKQQYGVSDAGAAPSGATTGSPVDLAKQMYELTSQFRQPAISTLETGRAGIAPAYAGLTSAAEAQKTGIESRYQQLLQDITGETQKGVTQEMTRRGIPISSGMTQDIVGQRVAGPIAQAGVTREQGMLDINQLIASLGMGEQGAYSDLNQAIASIQAAAAPEAISSAQQLYGIQEQGRQSAAQRATQEAIAQIQAQTQAQQLGWQQQQWQTQWPYQQSLLEAQAARQRQLASTPADIFGEGGLETLWEDYQGSLG